MASYSREEVLAYHKGGKVGAVDKQGNVVVPFVYDSITNASSGIFACFSAENGWKLLAKVAK